jgi:hypothetical protein
VILDLEARAQTLVGQRFPPAKVVERRIIQAEAELWRQTMDLRDEMASNLATAQIQAKLIWLKVQGKTQEHNKYLAAAGPFLEKKRAEARKLRQLRAEETVNFIRALHKQGRPAGKTSFWKSRTATTEEDC